MLHHYNMSLENEKLKPKKWCQLSRKDRLALDLSIIHKVLHELQSDSKETEFREFTLRFLSQTTNQYIIISQRCPSRHEILVTGEPSASYAWAFKHSALVPRFPPARGLRTHRRQWQGPEDSLLALPQTVAFKQGGLLKARRTTIKKVQPLPT